MWCIIFVRFKLGVIVIFENKKCLMYTFAASEEARLFPIEHWRDYDDKDLNVRFWEAIYFPFK